MKKLILALAVFSLMSNQLMGEMRGSRNLKKKGSFPGACRIVHSGERPYDNGLTVLKYDNRKQKIRQSHYNKGQKNPYRVYEYKYDRKGRVIAETDYLDGKKIGEYVYRYGNHSEPTVELGRHINYPSKAGEKVEKWGSMTRIRYDAKGRRLKLRSYNCSYELKNCKLVNKHDYNWKNNVARYYVYTGYSGSFKMFMYYEDFYTSDMNLYKSLIFSPDSSGTKPGKLYMRSHYKYKKGLLIHSRHFNKDGTLFSKSDKWYDPKGNITVENNWRRSASNGGGYGPVRKSRSVYDYGCW